jgi:pantoate--beta-alanine ligase
VNVEGPATVGLEDRFRPHFFGGVATVVAKLLSQVRPDVAVFGEKDFQQLKVVTQMARDLDLGVRILGAPIMRERDGLAMSSRNVYLSPEERSVAPTLIRTLKATAKRLRSGEAMQRVLADGVQSIEAAGFSLDYLEARHTETLAPLSRIDGPARLLVAARIGKTRLIDNIKV